MQCVPMYAKMFHSAAFMNENIYTYVTLHKFNVLAFNYIASIEIMG